MVLVKFLEEVADDRRAGQYERGDQRRHLETAAENHLEKGGVAPRNKSQAAAKPSGEAELTCYETAMQQHILGGNDALNHRSTSRAKCSTRATRSLGSGDRFWAATSLYLISGMSNATYRRRRGVARRLHIIATRCTNRKQRS
jgi:hypothetical protein